MRVLSLGIVLALTGGVAEAEEASVYGMQSPITGAFTIAKTNIACYAMDKNRCWDGSAWHIIYPLGPRHYAKPPAGTVACAVIMKTTHDCLDGSHWYRLPPGTLAGMTDLVTGTFSTAPLR